MNTFMTDLQGRSNVKFLQGSFSNVDYFSKQLDEKEYLYHSEMIFPKEYSAHSIIKWFIKAYQE